MTTSENPTAAPGPTYLVRTIGRNHYVQHATSRELLGAPFTSKRKAQARADERNGAQR